MRLVVVFFALFLFLAGSANAGPDKAGIDSRSIQQNNKSGMTKAPQASSRFYIALIIDDMGYRYQSGKRAINLPADITFSFLPYSPHARKLANMANRMQKEVMLHIPMEANNGKALGPGGLTMEMSKAVFDLELKHNLSAIPFIKGVNNHMGSLLTQQTEQMHWLMEKLAEKEIYFIDSRTSVNSQALNTARQFGIRSETRDIFVDHDLSEQVMQQQLQLAQAVAKRRGSAVVIAHPFPETLKVLEQWLPQAKQQGYEFVFITRLLDIRQQYRAKKSRLAAKMAGQKKVAQKKSNSNNKASEKLTQWQTTTIHQSN